MRGADDNRSMHDTDLYSRLLGLSEPWYVDRVELALWKGEVHVWVEHGEHQWRCPECEQACPVYDHSVERLWRHLDTMQYTTLVHARPPRVECAEHGVRQVRLPWSEPKSRFTLLFESFAIAVLREMGVAGSQRVLRLSRDEVWAIQQRAVKRGLARKELKIPEFIGIDEKAYAKGQDSYMTIISDLVLGHVEWIGDDRKAETLGNYLTQFDMAQREAVQAVAMDMWKAYALAIRTHIPDADRKIVYDRFHAMQEVTEAVDRVRKRENQVLTKGDDHRLKGTKYFWLRNLGNVSHRHRRWFAALRRMNLKTARAWQIKEMLRRFWSLTTERGAIRFWRSWFFWATHSRLQPVIAAARKLHRHVGYLINYFRHRITNAQAESLNGRIEKIKRQAHGFRNLENFKTAILFHLGNLDLYPGTHGKP